MRLLYLFIFPITFVLFGREIALGFPTASIEHHIIHSEILYENREIVVRFPDGYQAGGPIPVVYLTDAAGNFRLVEAYLDFSNGTWARLPDMVVVGILNTDRNRDLLPRSDTNFPNSGKGDQFLEFFKYELIPYVQAITSKVSPRIIYGHSFGGVNALNVLFQEPDLFDAYIVVGTSTWVSDDVVFERARDTFSDNKRLDSWLYMSVAEADGGATVPSGKEFAQLVSENAPEDLEWFFEIIPKTDHFSAVPQSLINAFHRLFPAWQQGLSLTEHLSEDGNTVRNWFDAQKELLGWRFHPQPWDLMVTAYGLASDGSHDDAINLIEELTHYHTEVPELYQAQGDIEFARKEFEKAKLAYERALSLAIKIDAGPPRVATIQSRLAQLD